MNDTMPRPTEGRQPRWRPLSAIDRRVAGVMVEKAKTTPDAYPMSVNALRSGCNQKNNRSPLMELETEDVEESLARLRAAGAATEVQGSGRVLRYRHYMYEWLGVDKVELAVMAELLLRGAQTEGELRGRAARMEPITDVAALRPVLASLKQKGLIMSLTPEGRGHVVTHALYEPRELEKVRAEVGAGQVAPDSSGAKEESPPVERTPGAPSIHSTPAAKQPANAPPVAGQTVDELRRELGEVRAEVAKLRKDLEDLWSNLR
jgi:hypothetical protein